MSTALSLSKRHPDSEITLVEASPTIPNPHGSSVDTSRIVRADYANGAYSRLAAAAIQRWRSTDWGREGRYTQNGLLLVYPAHSASAKEYARKSYVNVRQIEGDKVVFLPSKEDVLGVVPAYGETLDVAGGYVNWGSGWSDAAASVRFAKEQLDRDGKVIFRTGDVQRVLYDSSGAKPRATGVALADGSVLAADLVILAAGAWTPKLVDLRGKAVATGQAIAYIKISDAEQRELENLPTILNFATGIFIIPPRDNLLKIARHAYGYRNPTSVPVPGAKPSVEKMRVSLPETDVPVPLEGEEAFRMALKQLLPRFVDRPFAGTRICWYTDTYVYPLWNFKDACTGKTKSTFTKRLCAVRMATLLSLTTPSMKDSSSPREVVATATNSSLFLGTRLLMHLKGPSSQSCRICGNGLQCQDPREIFMRMISLTGMVVVLERETRI